MNEQKKMIIARGIFAFIIFVTFGTIVVTEKASNFLIPKIQEKMTNYIQTKYKNINNNLILNNITYKNTVYKMKVISKNNKNHYFYVYYKQKKITDTYKKDYLQGQKLLKNIEKNLTANIKSKTNTNCKVIITTPLNNFTSKVQEKIINEDNLLELNFYTIKKDITINQWTKEEIIKEITNTIITFQNQSINPKKYIFTITNKNVITESIEINNLNNTFINNNYKEQIITDIINDNNSKLLKENKIKYKFLN